MLQQRDVALWWWLLSTRATAKGIKGLGASKQRCGPAVLGSADVSPPLRSSIGKEQSANVRGRKNL